MTSRVDDMVDIIHADVGLLPKTLTKVAGYVTGSPDIQWTAQDWDRFTRAAKVRLSQRPGEAIFGCDVFDIEDHAWTIPEAIDAARLRKEHGRGSGFYFPEGMLRDADRAVVGAGLLGWVNHWVANPSLSRSQAIARLGKRPGLPTIEAWQWAFPETNPHTIVPGTHLKMDQVNCDLNVTLPTWHPIPHRRHIVPAPVHKAVHYIHPKAKGTIAGGSLGVGVTQILQNAGVHFTTAEAAAVATILASVAAYLAPRQKS